MTAWKYILLGIILGSALVVIRYFPNDYNEAHTEKLCQKITGRQDSLPVVIELSKIQFSVDGSFAIHYHATVFECFLENPAKFFDAATRNSQVEALLAKEFEIGLASYRDWHGQMPVNWRNRVMALIPNLENKRGANPRLFQEIEDWAKKTLSENPES